MTVLNISKALKARQAEREQRAPKGSVQGKKARQGKDKIPAGRKPVVTMGLGLDLVGALKAEHETVRHSLLAIANANTPSQQQALLEIMAARDADAKAAKVNTTSTIGKRKGASIRANYQRPITIVKAFIAKANVATILAQSSLAMMYAYATKGGSRGDGKGQLTGSGFKAWDKKLDRVCLKSTDADALARLEQHVVRALNALSKFEHASALPVKAMCKLAAQGRVILKKAA